MELRLAGVAVRGEAGPRLQGRVRGGSRKWGRAGQDGGRGRAVEAGGERRVAAGRGLTAMPLCPGETRGGRRDPSPLRQGLRGPGLPWPLREVASSSPSPGDVAAAYGGVGGVRQSQEDTITHTPPAPGDTMRMVSKDVTDNSVFRGFLWDCSTVIIGRREDGTGRFSPMPSARVVRGSFFS